MLRVYRIYNPNGATIILDGISFTPGLYIEPTIQWWLGNSWALITNYNLTIQLTDLTYVTSPISSIKNICATTHDFYVKYADLLDDLARGKTLSNYIKLPDTYYRSGSNQYIINHSKGYKPVVKILVGNDECIADVMHNDINTITINFGHITDCEIVIQ